MPVRRLILIFEFLTSFSSVQIRTQYGHMLTTLYVLSPRVNYLFLKPIPVFFKCVRFAVHISQICFHMQHVPAMIPPTFTMTGETTDQTTLILTSGQKHAALPKTNSLLSS